MPYTYGTPEWEEAYVKNDKRRDGLPAKTSHRFSRPHGLECGKNCSKAMPNTRK